MREWPWRRAWYHTWRLPRERGGVCKRARPLRRVPRHGTPRQPEKPANALQIGRRPRRRPRPLLPATTPQSEAGSYGPPTRLSRLPPTHAALKSPAVPLRGFAYGPANTCAVDTLLTVLEHLLLRREMRRLRDGGWSRDALDRPLERQHVERRSERAWRAVLRALRQHAKGERSAKLAWYRHMVREHLASTGASTTPRGAKLSCRCTCACKCSVCAEGQCTLCARCQCNTRRLQGHCFGIAEMVFDELLPARLEWSPFHMRSRAAWECSACPYRYSAPSLSLHLPLLLTVQNVGELLGSGVPAEVGCLVAAHFGRNAYDYGDCPQCGVAPLRARPVDAHFAEYLLVELERPAVAGSATSQLPYRLRIAPSLKLRIGSETQEYAAAATTYNNGAHWWADILSAHHFRRRARQASYRYDGLERAGELQYAGQGLIPTSDMLYLSLVWYRRAPRPADAA